MDLFEAISQGDAGTVRDLLAADPALGRARHPQQLVSPVLWAAYCHSPTRLRNPTDNRLNLARTVAAQLERLGQPLDLHEAATLDAADRVGALLDAGAHVDARSPDGFTPLQLAAYFGAPAAAALLIERGAHVDAVADNPQQVTALHAAVAGRHPEVVRLLLAAGAQPDARQHGGWTPLLAAAQHGDAEMVEALLDAGADPTAANDEGVRPAELARQAGYDEVAALLADPEPARWPPR
jgi:ankyrin repeat protein